MADTAPSRPSAPRRVHPVVWVLVVLGVPAFMTTVTVHVNRKPVQEQRLEHAAVQQLLAIQSAQTRYFSQFGRFATKLEELGPTAAGLIPEDLAEGIKTGYQFTLIGGPTAYTINANPVNFGTTGRRTFFSDQSNVIRENWGQEPAIVSSPEIR